MSPRPERHLHQAGYSLTEPRRQVIQYLNQHGSATSAELATGLALKLIGQPSFVPWPSLPPRHYS